jgi:hydroxymethylbilane synthase
MGYSDLIRQNLDLEIFTPSVGQGALAIEISETLFPAMKLRLQSLLQDPVTALAINAERSFLRTMEGGCSVPVFGYSTFENGILTITGGIISLDGKDEIRKIKSSQITVFQIDKAIILGKELAEEVLNEGGDSILSKIKQNLHP